MSVMGTITRDRIIEQRKKNPQRFVSIKEAVNKRDKFDPLFIMGLLAQNLESQGIVTAIDKDPSMDEEEDDEEFDSTSLQFMMNGLGTRKKFNLHFDLGNKRNEQLLNNEDEQNQFNEKLRKKIANLYNINEEDIIVSFPQRGSYQVTVIFKSYSFNNLNKGDLLLRFKEEPELAQLKDLQTDLIMCGCKLSQRMFDPKGNNLDGGWGINETRGGEIYIPPKGWIRYGLNVLGKYDDGNDDWLSYDHRPGEWCIAYHGVAKGQNSNNVQNVVGAIAKTNLVARSGQFYKNVDDYRHPGNKVGEGVYCTPDPNIPIEEDYAE